MHTNQWKRIQRYIHSTNFQFRNVKMKNKLSKLKFMNWKIKKFMREPGWWYMYINCNTLYKRDWNDVLSKFSDLSFVQVITCWLWRQDMVARLLDKKAELIMRSIPCKLAVYRNYKIIRQQRDHWYVDLQKLFFFIWCKRVIKLDF